MFDKMNKQVVTGAKTGGLRARWPALPDQAPDSVLPAILAILGFENKN